MQVHHILSQEYIIFDTLETKHSDPATPFCTRHTRACQNATSESLCVPTKSTPSSYHSTGILYAASLVILICSDNFSGSIQSGQILQAVSEAALLKRSCIPPLPRSRLSRLQLLLLALASQAASLRPPPVVNLAAALIKCLLRQQLRQASPLLSGNWPLPFHKRRKLPAGRKASTTILVTGPEICQRFRVRS